MKYSDKKTNKLATKFVAASGLIFLMLFGSLQVNAQKFYKNTATKVRFFSEAPLENIEAINESAASIINTETGEIAVVIPIKMFEFEKALMQEHFNENYMESDTYKNASFKGKFDEMPDLSKTGVYDVSATGAFTIHGVERSRTLKGKLSVKKNEITLESVFPVKLEDHDIEIPKMVFEKIAEVVEVTCTFNYEPKK